MSSAPVESLEAVQPDTVRGVLRAARPDDRRGRISFAPRGRSCPSIVPPWLTRPVLGRRA